MLQQRAQQVSVVYQERVRELREAGNGNHEEPYQGEAAKHLSDPHW